MTKSEVSNNFDSKLFDKKIKDLQTFIKKNPQYNSNYFLLADMSIPSGHNRFFVYDNQAKKVIDQGLVAHGWGSETNIKDSLVFKNIVNSKATSLGKYSIHNSYEGDFGKAYKLKGLDATNSKAFDRFIVLHKHSCVPEKEQENPICLSFGCPTLNENFFLRLQKILDVQQKPVLLWIYYKN